MYHSYAPCVERVLKSIFQILHHPIENSPKEFEVMAGRSKSCDFSCCRNREEGLYISTRNLPRNFNIAFKGVVRNREVGCFHGAMW